MASARARLGKARRGIIQRKKQTDVVTGALGALGTVAAFGAGQMKKADTAWKEYEAGYGEIPGADVADIKKPGFFKRTAQQFLPGGKTGLPEGEVRVGATMYDRSKIQKAGSFLGSDAAAALTPEMREQYLGRTAPGRDMTGEEVSTTRESLRPKMPFTEDEYDVDEEFGYDAWTAESPVYQQGEEPGLSTVGQDWQTPLPLGRSEPIQESEHGGVDPNPRGRQPGQWLRDFARGFTPGKGLAVHTSGERAGEIITDEEGYPGGYKPAFARGGDFITNGPQEILVGDNPGGRERVTIKPLSSKNDAEFGRYGDDSMKIIDGQPAHIDSSIEGDMSPEDIKKYGAGTINPITGKKEYFLGAIATGLAIGSSLYKGYQATQNKGDVEAGQEAAYDIQQQQLGFLGEQKGIAGQTAELGFDVTQSQLAAGARTSTMGAQTAIRDVQDFTTTSTSKSNLATSGTIQQKAQIGAGDVTAKLKSDMTKIFETRELAEREKDISLTQADLSYRKGEVSAEDAYQSRLTGLESTPTTFLEGMFS